MDSALEIGEPLLRIDTLRKSFGGREVLRGVSLAVQRGSLFSVIGPSGAGKSVFLKCLAGIERPDGGEIWFDGRQLGIGNAVTRQNFRRRCSFLFQSNALFDSLTAMENVALPLEQTSNVPREEIRTRSLEALQQLELDEHADHYPGQISGGMQKRLALARAIVTRPELVFFDEPTAGLDPLRRNAVFAMIAKYQRQFSFTALVVTHDLAEALIASDRVALLNGGRMCFEGTSAEFNASTHATVCDFRDSATALGNTLASIRRGDDTSPVAL